MLSVPQLPYAYNALEPYIDEQTMVLHHDKHHAAYVKNLNDALALVPEWLNRDITEILMHLEELPQEIRQKVRNHGGGHANHTFYWESLCAPTLHDKNPLPKGKLLESINKQYGSFESFQEQFKKTAMARFGSGWAWLVIEKSTLKITDTVNQDAPVLFNQIPLLGIDVWEHAYYLKYQNKRDAYIDAFFHVIDWNKIQERFENAQ